MRGMVSLVQEKYSIESRWLMDHLEDKGLGWGTAWRRIY